MESTLPLIRASNIQQNLKSLNMFSPSISEQIKQQIPEAVLSQVTTAARSEWLPLELDIAVTEAVCKVAGTQNLIDWSRDALVKSADGPLIGPFVRGSLRLFGITPAGLYKLGPKIWSVVYRNCGIASYKVVASKLVHVTIEGVPMIMRQSNAYLLGVGGAIEAPMVFCRVKGKIKLDPSLETPSSVCYVASWT
jgi:hypothetical protein